MQKNKIYTIKKLFSNAYIIFTCHCLGSFFLFIGGIKKYRSGSKDLKCQGTSFLKPWITHFKFQNKKMRSVEKNWNKKRKHFSLIFRCFRIRTFEQIQVDSDNWFYSLYGCSTFFSCLYVRGMLWAGTILIC